MLFRIMRRRLTDRQVTYLGIFLGILITSGIGGLWYAVRHVSDQQAQEVFEKDSLREVSKLRMAQEYAAEQALDDSIVEYERTHSAQAIAQRMQVIVSQELKKTGIRPYDPRYRTESFQELLKRCKTFDRDSAKKGWHFYDIPYYEYIPKKEVIGCEITRVYYVTRSTASADVRYDLNNDSIPSKTAVYRLVYTDGEWLVNDCIIDQESERESLRWYMDGYYFIERPDTTLSDSLQVPAAKPKSETKKAGNKPKAEKSESKAKSEAKPKADNKPKSDSKAKSDNKPKSDSKAKSDSKSKASNKPKSDSKPKSDNKPKSDSKTKSDNKPKSDSKVKSDSKSKASNKPKSDSKPKSDNKPKSDSKPKSGNKPKSDSKAKADSKQKKTEKK